MAALIAEDLLLLLLDDEKGTRPNLWVDLRVPLAAAVLAELAIDGAIEVEAGTVMRSAKLRATGRTETDPLLAEALAMIAEKPRSAPALVERLPRDLVDRLAERQVAAGVLERRDSRVLGLFTRTVWPARSVEHEQEVRRRLAAVLLEDAEPDERTVALAGILGAIDKAAAAVGATGAEGRRAAKRAKALAQGDIASDAVTQAVRSMMVAILTPVLVTTAISSGSS